VRKLYIFCFKMLILNYLIDFYGIWTYVTHTVFHASVVTVPVLAAAFLAAVPVAGQYLVRLLQVERTQPNDYHLLSLFNLINAFNGRLSLLL